MIPLDNWSYIGPPLEKGPLPTLIYLALSSKDSLETDPYNQPALFMKERGGRVFTLTLPEHEGEKKPQDAIKRWAEIFEKGVDPLTPFIEKARKDIEKFFSNGVFPKEQTAIAGLSRGAFFACHLAAKVKELRTILGYAPLTQLSKSSEFLSLQDIEKFDLIHLREELFDKNLRFYIGNRDKRVGTERCFSLVQALSEEAFTHRIRSSPIEMIIGPSIGYQGHGTLPDVFEDGIKWIYEKM